MSLLLKANHTFTRDMSPFGSRNRQVKNEIARLVLKHEQIYDDTEQKLMEPEVQREIGTGKATITARVTAVAGTGWPRAYGWEEIEPIGVWPELTYGATQDGQNSNDLGLAVNRIETVQGFGTTVGPWGASLQSPNATLTVIPIPIGHPIVIKLETNDSSDLVPMFSGTNAYEIECTTP